MLTLAPSAFASLRQHGEEIYPEESCGILLGIFNSDRPAATSNVATHAIPCINARLDSPRNRYSIDAKELIGIQRSARAEGLEIVGFYHSHPDHPATWSTTDLEEAHWLGFSYVITSIMQKRATETRSFRLAGSSEEKKQFQEEEIVVSEPNP